ncbi:MAG: permease-like cell division protein FtsX [Actinomycetes bacterium]
MRLRLVMSEMFLGLRRNITLTLAVVVTVAVSLILVGAALMLSRQVNHFKGYWYDKIQVTVQLCADTDQEAPCNNHAVTDAQRNQISSEIVALPQVERVYYESKQQAYQRAKVQFKDIPALLNSLTPDTLPESFRVKLKDPQKADVLISALTGQPGVFAVQDERKLLAPLFRVLQAFRNIAIGTAVGVLLAAVALIVNTIRIAVFSRRREIGIMRLVGASNLYIELPFLLEGAIAGLIGGLLAVGGVALIESVVVHGQLNKALVFTRGPAVGWGDVSTVGIEVLAIGVLMSTIVAFLTLSFSRATRV